MTHNDDMSYYYVIGSNMFRTPCMVRTEGTLERAFSHARTMLDTLSDISEVAVMWNQDNSHVYIVRRNMQ